jgi:hypothetical protein
MSAVALQGRLVKGRSLNPSECSRSPTRDCALRLPAAIRNVPNTRSRALSERRCMAAMIPAWRAEGRKGLHRAPIGHVLGAENAKRPRSTMPAYWRARRQPGNAYSSVNFVPQFADNDEVCHSLSGVAQRFRLYSSSNVTNCSQMRRRPGRLTVHDFG